MERRLSISQKDSYSPAPEWAALDARHVWHPYTQMLTAPPAVPVVRGDGAWLIRADGSRIFDAVSSWWVTLHGHAHPRIAAAIAEQAGLLEQVIFAGFTHEPGARLAARLAGLLSGDLDRIFYSDNGSTAVEVALKMCVQFWSNTGAPRTTFLALEGAYHGDTFGAMAVSGRSVFTSHFDTLLFDVRRLPFPGDAAGEEEMLRCAAREMGSGTIAGVIVEPLLLGAAGMKTWNPEALAELARLCRRHDVPLIADEVLTGFGRTGRMFAHEHAGITPDIVTLSKGLSGGFLPFAATVCRDHIYRAFLDHDRTKTLFHGHSYTGNPLGCAAALASLAIFDDEPVFERIDGIGRTHERRLQTLADLDVVSETRRLGTVAAIELNDAEGGYLSGAAGNLAGRALDHGILLRPLGNVLYLLPPYCSTEQEIDHVYDFIHDFLRHRD